ncbi:DUF2274 domain-containing protein [Paracoccus lutimaris]|uniref:DUF2274 domain-containing protein n=1 Tax=Paracoccus lutimaris TaxID=1490030 RepID=UPI003CCC7F17
MRNPPQAGQLLRRSEAAPVIRGFASQRRLSRVHLILPDDQDETRPIADDKPVKVTVELPAALHRDVTDFGRLLTEGGMPVEPAKLVVPMLERFVAIDHGFAKVRRTPP